MKMVETYVVTKQGSADRRGPTISLLLKSAGGKPEEFLLTREKATALVADLMTALEPDEDALDAGRIRAS